MNPNLQRYLNDASNLARTVRHRSLRAGELHHAWCELHVRHIAGVCYNGNPDAADQLTVRLREELNKINLTREIEIIERETAIIEVQQESGQNPPCLLRTKDSYEQTLRVFLLDLDEDDLNDLLFIQRPNVGANADQSFAPGVKVVILINHAVDEPGGLKELEEQAQKLRPEVYERFAEQLKQTQPSP